MSKIQQIRALEILDSRGNPTIEVEIKVGNGLFRAAVPSGASTGEHEAWEKRDGGKRYLGKGVKKVVNNIEKKIAPQLIGVDVFRQSEIDNIMIKLDGSVNKARLGANAILGISLACARAAAAHYNLTLAEYLHQLLGYDKKMSLPRPFFNVINGGKHADNKLSIQEFMIVPKFSTLTKNLQVGSEVHHILRKDLHKKYGKGTTNVGDEGGFAPLRLNKATDVLKMLNKAIKDAGYKGKVDIAIDCAASEFFSRNNYFVDGKKLSKEKLKEYYLKLIKNYPIISIEDPFDENDFVGFAELLSGAKKLGCQVVGDDLTVTNVQRIERTISEGSCNCLLLKVNQIGTLSEALDAVRLAYDNNWKVMVSHRSGETEDTFIADLAVGIGCGQIKAGAPCRGERTAKYNQLLRLERFLKEARG
jgi:enolase